ncbi:MAG: dTDP-4-dehydrorhamnose 3,5-epimerase [Candidatus Cloacimonetes bacterium]|nr:dTDP-4-dehydrorhamnose 3,5-epimerase [Candidatus Cloacimonadota bacterium]
MKIIQAEIKEILILKPDVFGDERGFFFESYHLPKYAKAGIDCNFIQDNISHSIKNTVRGLHFQSGDSAQGKLISVFEGRVLDIVVDIRKSSPTYGRHISMEISAKNKLQLWIPPGFAHGFAVLSESALFHYKCTTVYNPEAEKIILYNDSDLNIDWQVDSPVLSAKDLEGIRFADL